MVGRSQRKLAPPLDSANALVPKIGRVPGVPAPLLPLTAASPGPVSLAPTVSKAAPVSPGTPAASASKKRKLPHAKEPAVNAKPKTPAAKPSASGATSSASAPSPVVLISVEQEASDASFNLAAAQWKRDWLGHPGNPEPPTLIYKSGGCKIFLGGLPTADNKVWFRRQASFCSVLHWAPPRKMRAVCMTISNSPVLSLTQCLAGDEGSSQCHLCSFPQPCLRDGVLPDREAAGH